jgi:hypothetical protein
VQVKTQKAVWNDNEKVINVIIAPAIWQTIPFSNWVSFIDIIINNSCLLILAGECQKKNVS